MARETYTPGHSMNAVDFMSKRSINSHGRFFAPYLSAGLSVLDCGCGPGSITLGLAVRVRPGQVVGVDFAESQIARAVASASSLKLKNLKFQVADCYSLPFENQTFDRAFSHALLEHLSDPVRALSEIRRVLKPGGFAGVCSPDWGGFILSSPSPALGSAVAAYRALQSRNGGDVEAGRKLGDHLAAAGFESVRMYARYECYPTLEFIGEYLALQLRQQGDPISAETLHTWSQSDGGLFAQSWISAVGRKPN